MTFHQSIGNYIGTALSTMFYSVENFSILKNNGQWGLLFVGGLVGVVSFLLLFFISKKIYEWKTGQEAGAGGVIVVGFISLVLVFLIGGIANTMMQGRIFEFENNVSIMNELMGENITSGESMEGDIPTLDIRGNYG